MLLRVFALLAGIAEATGVSLSSHIHPYKHINTSLAVSDSLYASFQRYTNFSAAAYASSCPTPPFGASVVQYFANETADAHATLFEDSSAEEFIMAFKGTSDFTTLIADISQALGPFDTVAVDCSGCEVSLSLHLPQSNLSRKAEREREREPKVTDNIGPNILSRSVEFDLLFCHIHFRHTNGREPKLQADSHWTLPRRGTRGFCLGLLLWTRYELHNLYLRRATSWEPNFRRLYGLDPSNGDHVQSHAYE